MGRNLKVFFTILIFVAETCEALDCTKPEGPEATKCLEIFDELGEAANGLDISNKTRTTKMLENCEKFSRCRHTLGCRTDGLFVGVANAALMFCEYVAFFSKPFVPCQIILDARASECTKNWNPFPIGFRIR